MSKLIQIRQRIRAIETIRKITHAMRLIAMSVHSQLRNQEKTFALYAKHLEDILAELQQEIIDWTHPIAQPQSSHEDDQKIQQDKRLLLLIGSQKSLCGTFNTTLMRFFENVMQEYDAAHSAPDIIIVGKKITELARDEYKSSILYTFYNFSTTQLSSITQAIKKTIFHATPYYSSVEIVSNTLKNFFTQKPTRSVLIPLDVLSPSAEKPSLASARKEPLNWEHDPHAILNALCEQYLEAKIYQALFESLIAEQAARFISMDSATRNAKKLLDATRTQYNQLRQANITKELLELSGGFNA